MEILCLFFSEVLPCPCSISALQSVPFFLKEWEKVFCKIEEKATSNNDETRRAFHESHEIPSAATRHYTMCIWLLPGAMFVKRKKCNCHKNCFILVDVYLLHDNVFLPLQIQSGNNSFFFLAELKFIVYKYIFIKSIAMQSKLRLFEDNHTIHISLERVEEHFSQRVLLPLTSCLAIENWLDSFDATMYLSFLGYNWFMWIYIVSGQYLFASSWISNTHTHIHTRRVVQ